MILRTLQKHEFTDQVLMFVTETGSSMHCPARFLIHDCPTGNVVAETIEVFLKSSKRMLKFYQHCPGIRKPPQPIRIQWGTGLETVYSCANNFDTTTFLVLQFNPKALKK